jgi:hypothetical protein
MIYRIGFAKVFDGKFGVQLHDENGDGDLVPVIMAEIPRNNGNPKAPCDGNCPFHRPGVTTREYSCDNECSLDLAEGHCSLGSYIKPGPNCPVYVKEAQ